MERISWQLNIVEYLLLSYLPCPNFSPGHGAKLGLIGGSLALENDDGTYISNVLTAPAHTISGRATVNSAGPDQTESSETSQQVLATPDYSKRPSDKFHPHFWILLVYYRIFDEDGAIPSMSAAAPANPFLGAYQS